MFEIISVEIHRGISAVGSRDFTDITNKRQAGNAGTIKGKNVKSQIRKGTTRRDKAQADQRFDILYSQHTLREHLNARHVVRCHSPLQHFTLRKSESNKLIFAIFHLQCPDITQTDMHNFSMHTRANVFVCLVYKPHL